MFDPLLRLLPDRLRTVAIQMSRYAVVGLSLTLALAASYWMLADFAGLDPMVSFTIVFITFWGISYVTHGAVSFKGHGERDRPHVRASRYLAVSLVGYSINQFFVWFLVKQLDGPTWWPTVPMIFVTPLILFMLMRRFVYQ
ncbi:GtrA family protein [Sphingomicrobium astaxanthinifaciens]|uniref:GtrA family protein n=1 Tax=Sphingomicrobium astaxanthinifaciens TaxID=1227949 RepID=UPI001FCB1564|nr:GtrA family protein [Sphingomicrobium astaxanthinifaciens]MCJ7421409.1 GtrA family protein [Sphingomicrobium astaxanthinifaciens]